MVAGNTRLEMSMDAGNVEQVLDYMADRVSPRSFLQFLEGPAHSYMAQQIEWNFEGGGSPAGGRWEPLHDATQDIREELGYNPQTPINKRTGEMFEVLTKQADFHMTGEGAEMDLPGKAGNAYPVNQKIRTAQEGNAENAIANFGPTDPRPVLGITEFNAERILDALNHWIALDLASGGSFSGSGDTAGQRSSTFGF